MDNFRNMKGLLDPKWLAGMIGGLVLSVIGVTIYINDISAQADANAKWIVSKDDRGIDRIESESADDILRAQIDQNSENYEKIDRKLDRLTDDVTQILRRLPLRPTP